MKFLFRMFYRAGCLIGAVVYGFEEGRSGRNVL